MSSQVLHSPSADDGLLRRVLNSLPTSSSEHLSLKLSAQMILPMMSRGREHRVASRSLAFPFLECLAILANCALFCKRMLILRLTKTAWPLLLRL